MSKSKEIIACHYCGEKTVTIIHRQTILSKSIKVIKCTNCSRQSGIINAINALNR